MTFRHLACLFMTTLAPLAGASTGERLDRLERAVAELQSLVAGISARGDRKAEIARSDERESSGGIHHIRSGDSYWSISRRLGISVGELERANPGRDPKRLRIGGTLRLPGEDSAPDSQEKVTSTNSQSRAGSGTYTVGRGDILGRISEAHGIRLPQLLAANPGLDPRRLKIGQVLRIPGQSGPGDGIGPSLSEVSELPEEFVDPIPDVLRSSPLANRRVPPVAEPSGKDFDKSATILVTVDGNTRFAEIASRHRTSVAVLNQLNEVDLSPEQMIKTGSQIYVPDR